MTLTLCPPSQVNAHSFTMKWVNLHLFVWHNTQRALAVSQPCAAAGRVEVGALCTQVFTCFDDVTKFVQQEFVVSSSVQTLLHVAVQLVHHSLHVCVLVLLDTRHSTQVATPLDSFSKNGGPRQIVSFSCNAAQRCQRLALKCPTAACHSATWSSLPLTHPSPGFPPQESWGSAARAPQLWLERWWAPPLGSKGCLCKRQTSGLLRGHRAVYFCVCRAGEDKTVGTVAISKKKKKNCPAPPAPLPALLGRPPASHILFADV